MNSSSSPFAALVQQNSQYFQSGSGLLLPTKNIQESSSRGIQVAPQLWGQSQQSLEQYARMQLYQSRNAYFIYGKIYEVDTWVHACIDYIARRSTRDPNRLVDKVFPDNPDLEDLGDFLSEANEDTDFEDMYYGWVQDVLKFQQAYAFIERNRAGDPIALWPLDSRITFPVTDFHGTVMFHAQSYNGHFEFFDKRDILYFRINNSGTDPRPTPSLRSLVDSVAMELNANRYNAALFENNLNIGAIFTLGPNAQDEEVQDNDRYLREKYTKPENAHRHLILRGDAKLLRDGAQALKDIQFEEMIRMARHRVCAVFGVPESLIGIPDNTNRSTGQVHERNTYVNTIRPLRKLINRQFTRQFIRGAWGSTSISLEEPLSSMLPTQEEIDTAAKIAEIGASFNELREMINMPEVPNGDYYLFRNPANGGYSRADISVMPGLGDPHWDPIAYQLQHQAETQSQQDSQNQMAMTGVTPPQPGESTPYVPPRPQDLVQQEPIAARIIDISRALVELPTVSRRTPMAPGARGGNVYFTRSGKPRYGAAPQGPKAPIQAPDGSQNNNTITNPRDPNTPPSITPEQRLAIDSARTQVQTLLSQAQTQNWTDEQFQSKLQDFGWERPPEATGAFRDVRDARSAARLLSEQHPDAAFVLLGSEGEYYVMTNDLSNVQQDNLQGNQPQGTSSSSPTPSTQDSRNQGEGTGASKKEARNQGEGAGQSKREARNQGEGVKRSLDSLDTSPTQLLSLDLWAAKARSLGK